MPANISIETLHVKQQEYFYFVRGGGGWLLKVLQFKARFFMFVKLQSQKFSDVCNLSIDDCFSNPNQPSDACLSNTSNHMSALAARQ